VIFDFSYRHFYIIFVKIYFISVTMALVNGLYSKKY
jgi:hypothetical protein